MRRDRRIIAAAAASDRLLLRDRPKPKQKSPAGQPGDVAIVGSGSSEASTALVLLPHRSAGIGTADWPVSARALQAGEEQGEHQRPDVPTVGVGHEHPVVARVLAAGGRVVLFSSGWHLSPMAEGLPYSISKGAVHQMTRSSGAPRGRPRDHRAAINPGPSIPAGDPGALGGAALGVPARRSGRRPTSQAIVRWLVSAQSACMTGQPIDAEEAARH